MSEIKGGVKTLVVAMGGMGDLLLSTPAMRALREVLPGTSFDLLCRAGCEDIVRNGPLFQDFLPFAPSQKGSRKKSQDREALDAIRSRNYRRAIVFYGHQKLHLNFPQIGIPAEECWVRISAEGDVATLSEGPPASRHDEPLIHLGERYMLFAEKLAGCPLPRKFPEIVLAPKDREEAGKVLQSLSIEGPFWVCHVGMSSIAKRNWLFLRRGKIAHRSWREENWADLLCRTVHEGGVEILLTGTANEARVHRRVLSGLDAGIRGRVKSAAGMTRPLVMAAIIEQSRGYLGVDTGPMHVAAALGVPVVALFGPTDPRICGPVGPGKVLVIRGTVPCSPCRRPVRKICRDNVCMKVIGPLSVFERMRREGFLA